MITFVSPKGSYTLVLRKPGAEPVYDHKGQLIRKTGTLYIPFKSPKGASAGVYRTYDLTIADALRKHKYYGKSFTEMSNDTVIPKDRIIKKMLIKLPKTALLACKREELMEIAKSYDIVIDNATDTKATIIDKIINAQEKDVPEEVQGEVGLSTAGIKSIVQK